MRSSMLLKPLVQVRKYSNVGTLILVDERIEKKLDDGTFKALSPSFPSKFITGINLCDNQCLLSVLAFNLRTLKYDEHEFTI